MGGRTQGERGTTHKNGMEAQADSDAQLKSNGNAYPKIFKRPKWNLFIFQAFLFALAHNSTDSHSMSIVMYTIFRCVLDSMSCEYMSNSCHEFVLEKVSLQME